MTSAGHRTAARPAFPHIGRAQDDFVYNLNRPISTATVRLYNV